MHHIDEKFKDCNPVDTVERIRNILKQLEIPVTERWFDSGITHCNTVSLYANRGVPSYNGKGVTKELARASGHAEFIERLQGDLLFTKYQSIKRQKDVDIQSYAPDSKYMTVDELIENGQWMDYIVDAYKNPMITRQSIAEQCRAYACADDGKILTVPFYSLFEGKHVYLPMEFVNHIYATNGCCAGNTREEAWVHAFSEMMERHGNLRMLLSGKPAPRIPMETLEKFETVSSIIQEVTKSGQYGLEFFDYSIGNGFPVVSTRITDKKNHTYKVNVAADPVFEIALQRTLTELFQGRNLNNFHILHNGKVLNRVTDYPVSQNIINQLETSNGLYTADYLADELTCQEKPTEFPDNSNKTNKELLEYMLGLYRQLGKPVYVRNFSYLGFPSYRFVVPGFSECRWDLLEAVIPEYALADSVVGTLRDVASASEDDLKWMLSFWDMLRGEYGRENRFGRISGVPLSGCDTLLSAVTRAYASYKLGEYQDAGRYISRVTCENGDTDETANYFSCVQKYLEMKADGISEDKIRVIMYKLCYQQYADKLYNLLDSGKTPFDSYLLSCHYENCESCAYSRSCSYQGIREMIGKIGPIYRNYTNGQDPSEFAI